MKTIGLIGGMSWESSLEYYRVINEKVKEKLGKAHSCKSIMYSVDFAEIGELQHSGNWEQLTKEMCDIALNLENAGADFILICTNTMHLMAEEVQSKLSIPLLHIVDATANEIKSRNLRKVGLLGTKYTMEQDFYKGRLIDNGIEVIIPNDKDREIVHDIIYNELICGIISDESRNKYKKIIESLKEDGAEGVILGCTEIPLLIKQADCSIPLFDTTTIHATAAVELALKK
ncbi:MAG: aspartate/glutamate racemase family protein [Vulcanibacillus sp.]